MPFNLPKGWTSSGVDPRKLAEYSRRPDKWDMEDWQMMVEDIDALSAAREQIADVVPTGMPALADAFWTFIKVDPELADQTEMRPSHLVNHVVADEMAKLSETDRLRRHTIGDTVASAMAAVAIEPDLETLFDRLKQQQEKAQALMSAMAAVAETEAESHDLEEVIKKWSEEADPDNNKGDAKKAKNYQKQWEEMQEALEHARQQADKAGEEFEESMEQGMSAVRTHLRESIDKAADDAESFAQQCDTWGIEEGTLSRMPAEQRLELAKRLNNERFKRIADLFGPMRNLMLSEVTRKTIAANEEVFDVEMGQELDRILPEQLTELSNARTRLEFLRKFAEGELLQYKLRGTERKAQGGILFCTDEATEILTATGWKKYDQLEVGEMVLTLDHKTGMSEWHPLERINIFPAEPRTMLSMEGMRHSSLTTLDHRWPVLQAHRPRGGKRIRERAWKTSKTLVSEDRIPVAAECLGLPGLPKYHDDLVELVAWTWTEGTILPPGNALRIYQSEKTNPEHCRSIRAALTRHYGPPHEGDQRLLRGTGTPAWREDKNDNDVVSFHLNKAASEPILDQMNADKVVKPEFISSLTLSQLWLFIKKSIDGDGQSRKGVEILGQRLEARNKSFEMACILAGLSTRTIGYVDTSKDGKVQYFTSALTAGRTEIGITGGKFKREQVEYDGMVWCPTVANGTWMARRNGTTYFTGNCEDGSGSMSGERELWAKAVMLCLLHLARIQKRPFYLIHFGSYSELKIFRFVEPQDFQIEKVLAAAEWFVGGGTDFQRPLAEALQLLQEEHRAKGAVEGDIVFCTDGMCGVPPDFIEKFKEEQARLDFAVWGCNVGGNREDQPLYDICDGRVATIQSILDGGDIRGVFGSL